MNKRFSPRRSLCYFSCLMEHLHLHNLWARSVPHCMKLPPARSDVLYTWGQCSEASWYVVTYLFSFVLLYFYPTELLRLLFKMSFILSCERAEVKCLIIKANNIFTSKTCHYETYFHTGVNTSRRIKSGEFLAAWVGLQRDLDRIWFSLAPVHRV